MIQEHGHIALATDLANLGLKSGEIGTVVMVHREGEAFEVEFMTLDGKTIDIVTLLKTQVRPVSRDEIAHAPCGEPLK